MSKALKTEKDYFVKSIGYAPTKSGALRAKTFYLGAIADGENSATRVALRIQDAWEACKATGNKVWTDDALSAIKYASSPGASPDVMQAAPTRRPSPPMLEIFERYIEMLEARAASGQIGSGTVTTERNRVRRAIQIVGESLPIDDLDEKKLLTSVLAICSRPLTQHKHRKSEQKPMTHTSASEYLKSYRLFLVWASTTPRPGTTNQPIWTRPLRFEQIFQNRPILLDSERKAALEIIADSTKAEIATYTLNQLGALFTAADSISGKYGKLYLLFALNCGFANEEINDLKIYEIKFGKESYIHRFRGKTMKPGELGVYARWPLWDETALLAENMMETDEGDHAFLTDRGRRLIVKRSDFVRSWWDEVQDRVPGGERERLKIPWLSFKYLRKTASTFIQNELGFGDKIADAFLSHGRHGEIKKYTPQDWAKVAEAVHALRIHLQPMFDAPDKKFEKEQSAVEEIKAKRYEMVKKRVMAGLKFRGSRLPEIAPAESQLE